MLMWVNLIGTQPGGKEFLEEGVTQPGYEKNAEVVQATERLRTWHEEGWVNSDAFSGDFQDAATAYLSGSAATVANGPWFVKTNLKTDAAPTDLYGQTGYTLSPGWSEGERGVVTVTGAGWASGTDPHDDKDSEAVIAFLQFVSSAEETIRQAEATGANPPVNVDPEEFKAADVEPLSVQIVEQAEEATYSYPHVRVHGPAGFGDAWKNLWPAYVKGELDTREFLSRLGTDAAGRG